VLGLDVNKAFMAGLFTLVSAFVGTLARLVFS
jgi:hypothetical protein